MSSKQSHPTSNMNPKKTALSRLARLALNAASERSPNEHAEVCRMVAVALADDCPDLAELASKAAHHFSEATEAEADLLSHLSP
jgi:hypothetical protein